MSAAAHDNHGAGHGSLGSYAIGFVLSIILTGAALIREREHGTVEHLLVMPLTAFEIMLAKVWSMGVVVLAAAALSLQLVVRGWLDVPISGSLGMMAVLLVVSLLPVGSRVVNGSMYQVSNELEEAARTSGAGWFTTVSRVLLPLLAPALLTSFILLFLAAIRNLVLVVFFYTPNSRVLSVILWEGWNGQAPERALVAGILMMGLSVLALLGALVIRRRTGLAAM